ncbi:ABC transporter permease [Ideonella sp.]|uniref:ABC transporter permease n=1 Tax=Ideonella sp. TaxID=1929293 RepID=UPI002B465274|nr:ABC transporter permease [Ideonella sp.]HJV67818.1 ABC transporter permease [Ideonella sp.]
MGEWAPGFARAWQRERRLWARRPADWLMFSLVPLAAVLLTWSLFWAGTPRGLAIGVLDADHSAVSRQLTRWLAAAPGLRLAERFDDETAMQRALRRGEVMAVVWLPAGFSRDLKTGRGAHAALLHNAQFATHSGLIQRDVRSVVGTLSAGVEIVTREKRGESPLGARAAFEPMHTALVAQYNTSLDYEPFLATTLVPALLQIFAMVAGAWGVGRELRDRTVGAWVSAGGAGWAALAAKWLAPWAALVAVQLVFVAGLAGVRGWQPAGPLWPVLGLHALMLAVYLVLGSFAALAARSLRTALSAAGFVTAPAFAFAGVGFPLLAMPAGAQAWALVLPLTHVLAVQTAVWQMGAPGWRAAPAAAALLAALVLLAAACRVLLPRVANDGRAWGRR